MEKQLFRRINSFERSILEVVLQAGDKIARVNAGFPSPAEEYREKKLDLNTHLIQKPSSTFFIKAQGNALRNDGILHQDLLIVDRSLKPHSGSIVIVQLDGFLHVKKLIKKAGKFFLISEKSIQDVTNNESLIIWGVVIHAIHHYVTPS